MNVDNQTRTIPISPVLMGVLTLVVLGLALAGEFELIGREFAKRGVGAALALLLLLLGNQLPKLMLPPAARLNNPAPLLAAERLAATILVCAGLAALAVWIWWPAQTMMAVAGVIVLTGFALAAANWARVLLAAGVPARQGVDGLLASKPRLTILMLMHVLLWVAVIFLADSVWGDAMARWLLVPFLVLNGMLAVIARRRSRRQG